MLLWDKNRSMIVTIDNKELRWCAKCHIFSMFSMPRSPPRSPTAALRYLDSKDSPLSSDILNTDSSRPVSLHPALKFTAEIPH